MRLNAFELNSIKSRFFFLILVTACSLEASPILHDSFQTRISSGKLLFRSKEISQSGNQPAYVRGTLSLVFSDWQNLATIKKEIVNNISGRKKGPFRIKTAGFETETYTFVFSDAERLGCTYGLHTQNGRQLYFDFCYKITAANNYRQWAHSFAQKLTTAELSADFFKKHQAFAAKDLAKLNMPVGFSAVGSNAGRRYFVDSSGLAEYEVFAEDSSPLRRSDVAIKIYNQSIIKVLRRKKLWRHQASTQNKGLHCLSFQGKKGEAGNLCYTHVTTEYGKVKRLVIISKYQSHFIKKTIVKQHLQLLGKWQKSFE